ncbi:ATP-dependent helicase [Bacillus sp. NMCC4]|uniref:ATP-dependent helicase n=1 Tax=Bacillus sp. NMCC4 TaxID=2108539 RepID=UPI000D03090A|nr:ATP-dependent helicase [Bacillus sp. NMCC4]PRS35508.1 ATP-dependent helicase [Bacillus sp. NMCC4]
MIPYEKKLEQIKKDESQYVAYNSNVSTVVKAGPGSGKTTVLSLKIMKLLYEKIKPPRGLACITYNKEAVKEFTNRLYDLGYKKRQNVFLGTVHAFCIAEVISPYIHLYEYDIPLPLTIISEKNRKQIYDNIVSELGYDPKKIRIEDMDKERTLSIDGISSVALEPFEVALRIAKEYEIRLRSKGMVDFIEIVKMATLLIQNHYYVRKCLEAKFPWILIDEYQDLGKPLHEMVLALFHKTNIKIFAVGDPDQSIYSFNGAIPDYLNELYQHPNILPIELLTNYRSHQDIIDASLVGLNQEGRKYISGKDFKSEAEFHFVTCEEELDDQYNDVVNSIIPECIEKGIPLEEVCILVQGGKEIKAIGNLLAKTNIPFYVSKFDFKRSDVVMWLESCAAWVINNENESFSKLFDFWASLYNRHIKVLTLTQLMQERKKVYKMLAESRSLTNNLEEWLNFVIEELKLNSVLERSKVYPNELDNLSLLFQAIKDQNQSNYDLEKFVNIGKPVNQVTVSTRHSSKGLEFEVVIMLGMEDGTFPYYLNVNDPKKLSEDRRVFFVCVSRAKRICYLLRSKKYTRMTWNGLRTFYPKPSIFWKELYQSVK